MHESITIAEVGSMVKVSGSRIATPLGPPRPGSTPTKMPSTKPTSISDRILNVSRTWKPWSRRPSASMLEAEQGLERALGHDDVERDIERDEHGGGEEKARQQRLPPRDLADPAHEAGDEEEARDVQAEPLREEAKEERRHQHLHHAPQLVAVDEGRARAPAIEERLDEPEQARRSEEQRQVEREVARLRAVRRPARAALPVVPAHQRREGEEQERNDDVDRARAGDRARLLGRLRHSVLVEARFDHQALVERVVFLEEFLHRVAGEKGGLERLLFHVVLVVGGLRHLPEEIDVELLLLRH